MTASWRQALGDERLLVSGFGRWGGGIYDLTSGTPAALDNIPTSGLALGGGRLWRALRAPGEQTSSCELLSYDEQGLRSYERCDTIRDPHDICWHDGALHVSSSWDGIVWRTDPGREPIAAWRGGTVPDSWHVNSLVDVDGRLHVCAFGRFDRHKGWRFGEGDAAGFVHDTERGVDVLRDLAHPHHPRWAQDERWLLCESTLGSLTECAADGRVLRRVAIGRFSRGLTVVGRWALVGGNARRNQEDDRAEVVVVDLDGFAVVERLQMPCLEVYDILPVPFGLARGVAIGFGANPARAVEQHRGDDRAVDHLSAPEEARVRLVTGHTAAKLAAAGELMESRRGARCTVRGTLPSKPMAPGETQELVVRVVNASPLALATVPPFPIRVGARWIRLDDGDDDGRFRRGAMSALPRLLHPDEQVEVAVLLTAPDEPGRYEVRLALHQIGRGWFGRRTTGRIRVVATEPGEAGYQPADAATGEGEAAATGPAGTGAGSAGPTADTGPDAGTAAGAEDPEVSPAGR